ncbi:MAG TPA: alpha-1,2-fucosyltransferase [Humisphaera sp.]
MIIVQLHGGLGNQLFQYAAARALAARRRAELRLDVSHFQSKQRPDELAQFSRSFKLRHFHVDAAIATPADVRRVRDRYCPNYLTRVLAREVKRRFPRWALGHYAERSANFDPALLSQPDGVYVEGYLQSERYFKDQEPLIRRELTLRDDALRAYAAEYVARRRGAGGPVVAVHVRRGDLAYSVEVVNRPDYIYGMPVSIDYVRAGMARFPPGSTYLVFSDSGKDLDWCAQRIAGPGVHFCYGHSDLQDFAVMQACDHHVISNSTFSWWAAWLNPSPHKRVVAPRAWFDPARYPDYNPRSLIPRPWELL